MPSGLCTPGHVCKGTLHWTRTSWGWIGTALKHVEHAVKDAYHFYKKHKALIETIALTAVSAFAAGTGVGALVELGIGTARAAELHAEASTVLSVVGGVASGVKCVAAHDKRACVGTVLDIGAGVLGGAGSFADHARAAVLANLLKAKAFSISFGGLVWDTAAGRW